MGWLAAPNKGLPSFTLSVIASRCGFAIIGIACGGKSRELHFVEFACGRCSVELRKTTRYPLDLRVTFRWTNEGQDYFGTGATRDIGAAGMFVFSEDCPPCDARLSCEVTAPRSRSAGSLQINASGRVVRVEGSHGGTRRGFAVCGDVQLFSEDAVSGWMERSDPVDEV